MADDIEELVAYPVRAGGKKATQRRRTMDSDPESRYEGPSFPPADINMIGESESRPNEGRSPMMGRGSRRQFRGARQSEADRLMDIYNKKGGSSSSDIESAYRSINPTMKKGGKVTKKPMKISKPKAIKYARGGGIESRGKTRGKFV